MAIKYAVIDDSGNIESLTNKAEGNVAVDTAMFSTHLPMCYTYTDGGFVLKDNADALMGELAARIEAEEAERVAAEEAEALAKAEEEVRNKRNALLAESDWISIMHRERGTAIPIEWYEYRQDLRNITEHANFPNLEEADWPVKP